MAHFSLMDSDPLSIPPTRLTFQLALNPPLPSSSLPRFEVPPLLQTEYTSAETNLFRLDSYSFDGGKS